MTHEIYYRPKGIADLITEAHKNAVEHGWWEEERSFGEQIALMHSELSEALEEYRIGKGINQLYYSGIFDGENYVAGQPTPVCKKPEGIPAELADVIIRIFDTCGKYGIDLENAILEKMKYNKTRPYKHGGKKI